MPSLSCRNVWCRQLMCLSTKQPSEPLSSVNFSFCLFKNLLSMPSPNASPVSTLHSLSPEEHHSFLYDLECNAGENSVPAVSNELAKCTRNASNISKINIMRSITALLTEMCLDAISKSSMWPFGCAHVLSLTWMHTCARSYVDVHLC